MWNKISNRGTSQTPKDQIGPAEDYDFGGNFDARAEDDDGMISIHEPKSISQSIKTFMQLIQEKISNWLQPVRDFLEQKF